MPSYINIIQSIECSFLYCVTLSLTDGLDNLMHLLHHVLTPRIAWRRFDGAVCGLRFLNGFECCGAALNFSSGVMRFAVLFLRDGAVHDLKFLDRAHLYWTVHWQVKFRYFERLISRCVFRIMEVKVILIAFMAERRIKLQSKMCGPYFCGLLWNAPVLR